MTTSTDSVGFIRDGTSQADRLQTALKPDYVAIDEHSSQDLLRFAQGFAKQLRYVNADNQVSGDWQAFLGENLDVEAVLRFMDDPKTVTAEQARQYQRPHFALFLTFLKLLEHNREQMNGLGERHLQFYYHQVLGLQAKPAQAASVHLLLGLQANLARYRLDKNTQFAAGDDAQGNARIYQTDEVVMLSQAKVAKLRSCYIDSQITTLKTIRHQHRGSVEDTLFAMLTLALAAPNIGDELPLYADKKLDLIQIRACYDILHFIRPQQTSRTGLYLEYNDFRQLISLQALCQQQDPRDWQIITTHFNDSGKKRSNDPAFTVSSPLSPSQSFDAQFFQVLGVTSKTQQGLFFDGITEVNSFDDVYTQRQRQTVQDFIKQRLYLSLAAFTTLMQTKLALAARWRNVLMILQQAGQKQRQANRFTLSVTNEFYSASAFQNSLKKALPDLDFNRLTAIADLASLNRAFLSLQAYFFLSAEQVDELLSVFIKALDSGKQIETNDWQTVYALLKTAYQQKIYAQRQAALQHIHTDATRANGLANMLAYALGTANQAGTVADQLGSLSNYLSQNSKEESRLATLSKLPVNDLSEIQSTELYGIVERAQRRREQYQMPPLEQRQWRNLYPLDDATLARPDSEANYWRSFGQAPTGVIKDDTAPVSLGWGISSPLLLLRAGKRELNLALHFAANSVQVKQMNAWLKTQVASPFRVLLSTAKGWHDADFEVSLVAVETSATQTSSQAAQSGSLSELHFTIRLNEQVDALTAPIAKSGILATTPVLKILLRQHWQADQAVVTTVDKQSGYYRSDYQPFKLLKLQHVKLQVAVQGLVPQAVHSDEQALDAHKPFYPFGLSPSIGSRLYLGDPELSRTALDRLSLDLEWMDVPASSLKAHYKNYPNYNDAPLSYRQFNSAVQLVDKGLTLSVNDKAILFAKRSATPPYQLQVNKDTQTLTAHLAQSYPSYHYGAQADYVYADDPRQSSRYWQWQLNSPDFQHSIYPSLATQKGIDLSLAIAQQKTDIKATDYQVNPPYTPQLKGLKVNYKASLEMSLKANNRSLIAQQSSLYHLHPFGYSPCQADSESDTVSWLPQYDQAAYLYIGLQDVVTPQRLSLLFQMAEGSADVDLTSQPIHWHYLSDNRWQALENGKQIIDHSAGLNKSAVIQFELPVVKPSTLLNDGLYYLRASIIRNSRSVCDMVAIHSQVVAARCVTTVTDPADLFLDAKTITTLVEPQAQIVKVSQPYATFGGQASEQTGNFYTRVSERLRHKQRAISTWDYEHLVLQQFPQVYKVKCLASQARGKVTMLVIPDIRQRIPFDPFAPKVAASLLNQVQTYLQAHSSPFANITVKNAHYVAVKVRCSIRFKDVLYNDFYKQQLNHALNRFLSPWAYDDGTDIVIGSDIYANSIVNFIEQQPYVDYVAGIKLFRADDEQQLDFKWIVPQTDGRGYRVSASQSDSVLVAAHSHVIDMINDIDYQPKNFSGLDYMKVELDFVVT